MPETLPAQEQMPNFMSLMNDRGGILNVENLRAVHEFQESGKAIDKTVLEGFAMT